MDDMQLLSTLTIAKEHSISAAAEKLLISPQGLKRRIDALEAELGYTIFTRDYAGCTLTEQGETFVSLAPNILADMQTLKELNGNKNPYSFVVGTSQGRLNPVIDAAIAEFEESGLGTVGYAEKVAGNMLKDIAAGKFDVALSSEYLKEPMPKTIGRTPFSHYTFALKCFCTAKRAQELNLPDPVTTDILEREGTGLAIPDKYSYPDVPFQEFVGYEKYDILTACRKGLLVITDEYFPNEDLPLRMFGVDFPPIRVLAYHRKNPPLPLRQFLQILNTVSAQQLRERASKAVGQ